MDKGIEERLVRNGRKTSVGCKRGMEKETDKTNVGRV